MSSTNERDGELAGFLAIVLVTAIVTAIVLILQLLIMESVRIYRENAGTEKAKWLWESLAGLALFLAVAAALMASPATMLAGVWIGSTALGVWCVVIEVIDHAGPKSQAQLDEQDLHDVIAPWRFSAQQPDGQLAA